MTGANALVTIGVLTGALLLPSCTRVVDDARAVAGAERTEVTPVDNPCTPVDVPLATIPTDADEPVLKIPQPPGWTRFSEMDSDIVRYTMRNEDFGGIAVVTAESMDGIADPDDAFRGVHEGVTEILGPGTQLDITSTEHCGLPAETMPFVNPGFGQSGEMPTEALTVVMVHEGRSHVVSVQVGSKRLDEAVPTRDAETILTGFHILPPPES